MVNYVLYVLYCTYGTNSAIKGAGPRRRHPPSQAVGNVRGVAVRSDTLAQVTAGIDRARVVDPRGLVEGLGAGTGRSIVQAVGQAVAGGCTGSCGLSDQRVVLFFFTPPFRDSLALTSFTHHLSDGVLRAGVYHIAVAVVASGRSVVVLHQARVGNSAVAGRRADAAGRLLHDDSQDEAVVDVRLGGDLLDGVPDATYLGAAVVRNAVLLAAGEHGVLVVVEPGSD